MTRAIPASGARVSLPSRLAVLGVVAILTISAAPAPSSPDHDPAPRARPAPQGEWIAGDLHVHTTYSHDSYSGPDDDNTGADEFYTAGESVEAAFRQAQVRGLDFLAISDHNDIRSQSDPGFGRFGVIGLPAYENSLRGHAQMLGATQVYDKDDDSAVGVAALADQLRADGGAFQVNHPADPSDPDALDWTYGYEVVPDTVEAWNVTTAYQPPFPAASDNDANIAYWEGWPTAGHTSPRSAAATATGSAPPPRRGRASRRPGCTWPTAASRGSSPASARAARASRRSRRPPLAPGCSSRPTPTATGSGVHGRRPGARRGAAAGAGRRGRRQPPAGRHRRWHPGRRPGGRHRRPIRARARRTSRRELGPRRGAPRGRRRHARHDLRRGGRDPDHVLPQPGAARGDDLGHLPGPRPDARHGAHPCGGPRRRGGHRQRHHRAALLARPVRDSRLHGPAHEDYDRPVPRPAPGHGRRRRDHRCGPAGDRRRGPHHARRRSGPDVAARTAHRGPARRPRRAHLHDLPGRRRPAGGDHPRPARRLHRLHARRGRGRRRGGGHRTPLQRGVRLAWQRHARLGARPGPRRRGAHRRPS